MTTSTVLFVVDVDVVVDVDDTALFPSLSVVVVDDVDVFVVVSVVVVDDDDNVDVDDSVILFLFCVTGCERCV